MSQAYASPVANQGCHAAAYVRMSTDTQDMSIAVQLDYIARYAAVMGYSLRHVYREEGRSGLTLRNRPVLRQILADVAGGDHGFDVLLVYDVSRWGRFQDIDASAAYEFQCLRAGVEVVYCAEAFSREISPLQHLMKDIKRVMAGEHSRELSAKVFESHVYLLRHGYKAGGVAGYGLRRLSVCADGTVRRMLNNGERKCHLTDRVVLAPGPPAELRVVQQIFKSYIEQRLSYAALARRLNHQGVPGPSGRTWEDVHVRAILTNEKYCGNLLYNRTSCKMETKRISNAMSEWHRCKKAHAAIVSPAVFAEANRHYTLRCGADREAVLERLRDIYVRHGRLSYRLIEAEPGLPHAALLTKMFGSLEQAYGLALAGLAGSSTSLAGVRTAQLARQFQEQVCGCIERAGHQVNQTARRCVLLLDGRWSLRIAVASQVCKSGCLGWRVPAQAACSDFVICGLRMRGEGPLLHFVLLATAQCSQHEKWMPATLPNIPGTVSASSLESLFGLTMVA